MDLESLKYPIGHYAPQKSPNKAELEQWVSDIEMFPQRIIDLTKELSIDELQWRYRPEGWSIKQVVHHCADSHLNSIMRFKLALTEDKPRIRPYFEDRWAKLEDGNYDDLSTTLFFIEALHAKWVKLLKTLQPDDLSREYIHPEHNAVFNLAETIGNYAWHGNHHLAHISNALKFRGNFEFLTE